MSTARAFIFMMGSLISVALWGQSRGNILNAEYSWDSGPAIPLIASDGDFNSAIEDVVSESSLTFPSGGSHVFSIRVQDEDGTWSPNFRRVVHFPVTGYSRDLYITQAEYFWDSGPAIPLIAFDGDFNSAIEDAMSEAVLPPSGPHVLSIRAKDIDGNWSPVFRRVVVVEDQTVTRGFNITHAEYSWDSGTAIPLIAFDGDFNSAVEEVVSESSLTFPSGGSHVFSIRVQDEDGTWSPNFSRVVHFPVTGYSRDLYITEAEYFWDSGPAIPLIAFDGDFNSAIEDAMSEAVLPPSGPHVLSIRAKDVDGNWSPAFRRVVVVEDQTITRGFNITHAEYSWDSGTAIPLIAFDGDFNSAVEGVVSESSLTFPSGGSHVFSIRVQDEEGAWSPNFRRVVHFPVTGYSRDLYITQAEYFWNSDPGQGNGIPLIAFDGDFDAAFENLVGPNLELVGGVSVFHVRVRDVDGTWSPTFKRVVSLEAAYGCTDETAFNFNPLAFYDDGTCVEFVYGCMDETQFNYNPEVNTDDGSCIAFAYGCTDNTQFNYDPLANTDDGTCIEYAYGCTDATQFNYDPLANTDDGTCIEFIYGCTDDTQFNYNPAANTDDGTCIEFIYGCTIETAFNYDAGANTDDGTCITDCVGAACCYAGVQWDLNTFSCDYENLCPADIVKDGFVAVDDLLELLSAFGYACEEAVEQGAGGEFCIGPACCGENTIWCDSLELCIPFIACPADITLDESIGVNDLLTFLIYFGTECDQSENFIDCGEPFVPWSCGDPWEYQGYDYETVQIGGQCWFAENLRSSEYRSGVSIPTDLSDSEWSAATSGAAAVYGSGPSCLDYSPDGDACDEAWSLNEYGRLYNWFAVDDPRGLCPNGWHVPSNDDWSDLIGLLGGEAMAGQHLKSEYGWNGGGQGTNSSGFSGLPAGDRSIIGFYDFAGHTTGWWTSTADGASAWARGLSYAVPSSYQNSSSNPRIGFSVRCLKNTE